MVRVCLGLRSFYDVRHKPKRHPGSRCLVVGEKDQNEMVAFTINLGTSVGGDHAQGWLMWSEEELREGERG